MNLLALDLMRCQVHSRIFVVVKLCITECETTMVSSKLHFAAQTFDPSLQTHKRAAPKPQRQAEQERKSITNAEASADKEGEAKSTCYPMPTSEGYHAHHPTIGAHSCHRQWKASLPVDTGRCVIPRLDPSLSTCDAIVAH